MEEITILTSQASPPSWRQPEQTGGWTEKRWEARGRNGRRPDRRIPGPLPQVASPLLGVGED